MVTTWCREAEVAASALQRWSLRHALASLDPLAKLRTIVAFAVTVVALAIGAWALIYRALAYMSLDRRFGVFGATEHPRVVIRSVFVLFSAAVAVKCFLDGRSMLNIACIVAVSAAGAHRAQRGVSSAPTDQGPLAVISLRPPAVTCSLRRGSN